MKIEFNTPQDWLGEAYRKTKNRLDYTAKETVREIGRTAQHPVKQGGNMPVLTGKLRGSFNISVDGTVFSGPEVYNDAADVVEANQVITMYWTAYYAYYVEFGAQRREPRLFATTAVDRAPVILAQKLQESKTVYP